MKSLFIQSYIKNTTYILSPAHRLWFHRISQNICSSNPKLVIRLTSKQMLEHVVNLSGSIYTCIQSLMCFNMLQKDVSPSPNTIWQLSWNLSGPIPENERKRRKKHKSTTRKNHIVRYFINAARADGVRSCFIQHDPTCNTFDGCENFFTKSCWENPMAIAITCETL